MFNPRSAGASPCQTTANVTGGPALRMLAIVWTISVWTISLAAVVVAGDAPAENDGPDSDTAIEAILAPIRDKYRVPGLIAGIANRQGLVTAGVVGVRKFGSAEPMTVNDKLHLGSNTKAMTATRIAMLVEEGKLAWESTPGDVFPEWKAEIHDDLRGVTLEQLLTHRAGLPANMIYPRTGGATIVDLRESMVKRVLAGRSVHPPGTKFLYSNVGYIVAGHMAEQVTGKSWEELMTDGLFTPLKMTSAGFGVPETTGSVDQPWGHRILIYNPIPVQWDNPPVLGPAGTVHCSLKDWAKFAALHLQAPGEGTILKPESFQMLHTPSGSETYAKGWVVKEHAWADGPVLGHSGSNTMWFATIMIAPQRDLVLLAATNVGPASGAQACDAAIAALIEYSSKAP